MAREDLHFRLRIPEDLKKSIEEEALVARRSMTAEIVARLEQSFVKSRPKEISVTVAEVQAALSHQIAVNEALRANFQVLAEQLAGPVGENREEVIRVLSALRVLGKAVPE